MDGISRASQVAAQNHQARIREELKDLGVTGWGLWHSEAQYLPRIIHPNEHLGGIVYGFHGSDFAYLVVTDQRVIFLDKKPLLVNEEEFAYNEVSGVSYDQAPIGSTVILYTKITDFPILTFNHKCAQGFVDYIEQHVMQSDEG